MLQPKGFVTAEKGWYQLGHSAGSKGQFSDQVILNNFYEHLKKFILSSRVRLKNRAVKTHWTGGIMITQTGDETVRNSST